MMAIRSEYELAELYCTETEKQFARKLYEILLQTGLPPRRLELEITETALVRDLDRALVTLRQIKALGVRVAMVDFGTGYSSSRICGYFRSTRLKSTPHSSNLSIATNRPLQFQGSAWPGERPSLAQSLPKGSRRPANSNSLGPNFVEKAKATTLADPPPLRTSVTWCTASGTRRPYPGMQKQTA